MRERIILSFLLLSISGCASRSSLSAPRPPNWPDLSTLNNYRNPFGDTCSEDGTTRRGNIPEPDKILENEFKNRFVPPSSYTAYTVANMLRLPNNPDDKLENTGVTLTGYIRDVKPGGTEGESCNCEATGKDEVDAHIEVETSSDNDPDGRGMVVVEVTERSRRLAALGLLDSSFGRDWSTDRLREELLGKWVQISGWLLYDSDHVQESWSADPDDTIGRPNWRGTPWEVHPVMGLEVLTSGPSR